MDLLIWGSRTINLLLIFSGWKVNWPLVLWRVDNQCLGHSRWILGSQLHLLMMSSIICGPIWHSLHILSKLRSLGLHPVCRWFFCLQTVIALLSRSSFIQGSSPRFAFHIWHHFLFVTLNRIRVHSNTGLRSLVVNSLRVTLFQLRFVGSRLCSVLRNSYDVIRIHGSIHT